MPCFFEHNWGWPRKIGNQHIQTCTVCGRARESKIKFDGPRYVLTRPARPKRILPGCGIEQPVPQLGG